MGKEKGGEGEREGEGTETPSEEGEGGRGCEEERPGGAKKPAQRRDPAGQKTRAEGKSELSLYFNLRWEESKKRSARHCVTL